MSAPASEQQIKLAARMYDGRDAAKTLFGEHYRTRLTVPTQLIKDVMAKHKCTAMPAAMALITQLQKEDAAGTKHSQLAIMAAMVEMIEPSED